MIREITEKRSGHGLSELCKRVSAAETAFIQWL